MSPSATAAVLDEVVDAPAPGTDALTRRQAGPGTATDSPTILRDPALRSDRVVLPHGE